MRWQGVWRAESHHRHFFLFSGLSQEITPSPQSQQHSLAPVWYLCLSRITQPYRGAPAAFPSHLAQGLLWMRGCCGWGVCCLLLQEGPCLEACHSYHFLLGAWMLTFPRHTGAPMWVKGLSNCCSVLDSGKTWPEARTPFDTKVSTILLVRRPWHASKLHRINRVIKIIDQGAREDSGSVPSTDMVAHNHLKLHFQGI